ncbi:zinc finger protein Helios [Dunckerocampus dactyliophorus]|uniref:zinc finger protein Helios n=1 Tax=Dunckerocampus dactyliophorus TaxID=161453 RepID=UPI002405CDC2|nr:zinc finger protein Helios [Dunckerocampus dactyliophorus]XP_054643022.1 zinc finger protein Helios [Dunckerocampus dactyliophorus]XP_054643023.1 zinc finger protein Helios [Dunckerocampus dactyliophorus]
MEAPNGYSASNGQCSPGKEKSRMSTPTNTGQNDPYVRNCPSELADKQIKQEEDTNEEAHTSPAREDQTGKEGTSVGESMSGSPNNTPDRISGQSMTSEAVNRQPNGDRPFQCNQCGVSFTQKGNLLRHIKLHTGEKPFKCPFCNYACRRRDALTGHLRTHAVGKPHKCNYCGRSYKQRSSLEEHRERCHSYLHSIGLEPATNTGSYAGEVPKDPRPMTTFDRPLVIERLHSNVGKRKSTTPQKFVGEKMVRYSYPEMGYEMGLKFEKQPEFTPHMMDQAMSNAITYLGSDTLRPIIQHPGHPLSMTEVVPMVNPLYHHVLPLGHRAERTGNMDLLPPQPPLSSEFPSHTISNGPAARQGRPTQSGQEESPSISGGESPDSARSSPQERHANPGSNLPPSQRSRSSPAVYSGDHATEVSPRSGSGIGAGVLRESTERLASQEAVRVFGREGRELRAFQCDHCQVLFLDHVMYTIHMGCHGYRNPLECNICGHHSKDRYEFSSHIVRGEHTFQ